MALRQWYETMIPALFPMMLISSILTDTKIAQKMGRLCNKTIFHFLHISDNGCYCLAAGFLFGFPMGAKTASDLLNQKALSRQEAEFLLCFINCIGPMYTINVTHKAFQNIILWKLLIGTYGIPLLYGILLRYTLYRKEHFENTFSSQISAESFLDAFCSCVPKCGKSILILGGCMVLFQLSFVTLEHFLASINLHTTAFYPLLELTGGLSLLKKDIPLPAVLFYTAFGGSCCFLQTYTFLKPAGLSFKGYVFHKSILAVLCCLFGVFIA